MQLHASLTLNWVLRYGRVVMVVGLVQPPAGAGSDVTEPAVATVRVTVNFSLGVVVLTRLLTSR